MTLRSAHKLLICRSALALAAVLLHSASAISAVSADGGHAQARALLSGATAMRVGRTSTTLSGAGLVAFAHDPQDQARALLAKSTSRNERRTDDSGAGVTDATSAQSRGTAYAGAQESARKMILGRGA